MINKTWCFFLHCMIILLDLLHIMKYFGMMFSDFTNFWLFLGIKIRKKKRNEEEGGNYTWFVWFWFKTNRNLLSPDLPYKTYLSLHGFWRRGRRMASHGLLSFWSPDALNHLKPSCTGLFCGWLASSPYSTGQTDLGSLLLVCPKPSVLGQFGRPCIKWF